MSTSRFVHLHVHTEFSLADSTIRVPEKPDQADPKKAKQANLLSRAVELDMPALAVTDLNNLFALVKFYKAAEGVGIKPIAGADVMILETGTAQPEAMALYESAGYQRVESFGYYRNEPLNCCYGRVLGDAEG